MKTTRPSRNHGSIIKLLLLLMIIGVGLVASVGAMIYLSVRPSHDFRGVQDIIMDELPQKPNLAVSVRAPQLLVSLARFGLSFVDDIDDEAHLAIQSVRGGQVGVYQLPRPVPQAHKLRIMKRIDRSMAENQWTRVAAVVERDELVLLYVPGDLDDPADLEVLTIVLGNEELVMVSAKGDLRPIYQIAQSHLAEASDDLHREFD